MNEVGVEILFGIDKVEEVSKVFHLMMEALVEEFGRKAVFPIGEIG